MGGPAQGNIAVSAGGDGIAPMAQLGAVIVSHDNTHKRMAEQKNNPPPAGAPLSVGDVPSSLRYPGIGVNDGGPADGMIAAAQQVMKIA
jgi:hypothetical protein